MASPLNLGAAPRGQAWGQAPSPLSCPAGTGSAARPAARRRLRCRAEVQEAGAAAAPAADADAAALDAARAAAEASLQCFRYDPVDDEPADAADGPARLRRRLEAVARELGEVSEAEHARLTAAAAVLAGAPPAPPAGAVALPRGAAAQRRLGAQLAEAAGAVLSAASNIVPLRPRPPGAAAGGELRPEGSGEEVLLQGFNWESWRGADGAPWFAHVEAHAERIAAAGFTAVWLPPFTDSVSPQGYMPGDLYCLDSKYGSEAQLRACVRALQARGLKVLGDAVLNHRCAQRQDAAGVWNVYGSAARPGKLEWDARAIVGDDPNFRGRGNRSTGDHFCAAPNIDHSQDFVKADVCEWLRWLRAHVGFDGWRLDFVKGFHGSHVRDYMAASAPAFAVGEHWTTMCYEWDGQPAHNQDAHRQATVDWINAAGGSATAFDVTTKGILHAAFERCEFWRLRDAAGKPPGLLGWWPSRAVTFLENHDTGSTQGHWRFPGHALEQGYAYILTHPGTPTVFWDHAFGGDRHLAGVIGRLLALRRRAALNCRSPVAILEARADVYAAAAGAGGRLVVKLGPGDFAPDMARYKIADNGHGWAVWELKDPPPAEP